MSNAGAGPTSGTQATFHCKFKVEGTHEPSCVVDVVFHHGN